MGRPLPAWWRSVAMVVWPVLASDHRAAQLHVAGEPGQEAEALRAELQAERRMAAAAHEGDGRPISPVTALRAKAVAVRRNRLLAMRSDGVIGDEAFHQLEEELDFWELAAGTRT